MVLPSLATAAIRKGLTKPLHHPQNVHNAQGSNASVEYVQDKASGNVDVLRSVLQQFADFFGVSDYHRRHREVNADADIAAIRLDLEDHGVHKLTGSRRVPPPKSRGKKKTKRSRITAVRDVLMEGMVGLTEGGLFEKWKKRTSEEEAEEIETGNGQGNGQGEDSDEAEDNVRGNEDDEQDQGFGFEDEEGTFTFDVDDGDDM